MRLERGGANSIFGTWWWTIDRYMLIAVGLLIFVGIALMGTASSSVAARINLSAFHFVSKQLVFLAIGIVLMVGFSLMDELWVRRIGIIGFLIFLIMLMLVYVMGTEIKGARRWLYVLGVSFQPSEMIKPFFAIVNAYALSLGASYNRLKGYSASFGLMCILGGMVVFQPDIGMTFTLFALWFAQLFVAGLNAAIVAAIAFLGAAGMTGAYFAFPHVAHRINAFLDPESGDNYQVGRSLEAILNGGFLGRGPGEGVVSERLPDSHTDFIFAVAAEEFGTLFCMVLAGVFAFIFFRGITRVIKENNLFILYAAVGMLTVFALQSVINMSVALNLVPNKGMTMPFISYGGSAMLTSCMNMGFILALTRKRFGALVRRPHMS